MQQQQQQQQTRDPQKEGGPQRVRLGVYPPPANLFKNLVYGGTAGLIGAVCMFPIDTAKTRFQNEKVALGQRRQYSSILDALVKIAKTQGTRGLYRGLQV
jgi:hypothetical protein